MSSDLSTVDRSSASAQCSQSSATWPQQRQKPTSKGCKRGKCEDRVAMPWKIRRIAVQGSKHTETKNIQMISNRAGLFFSYAKPHGPTGGMDESLSSSKKRGRVSQSVSWMQKREGVGRAYIPGLGLGMYSACLG